MHDSLSVLVGRQMDDIAAGAFVTFQLQLTAALPVFQELAESPKTVIIRDVLNLLSFP